MHRSERHLRHRDLRLVDTNLSKKSCSSNTFLPYILYE